FKVQQGIADFGAQLLHHVILVGQDLLQLVHFLLAFRQASAQGVVLRAGLLQVLLDGQQLLLLRGQVAGLFAAAVHQVLVIGVQLGVLLFQVGQFFGGAPLLTANLQGVVFQLLQLGRQAVQGGVGFV